MVMTVQKIRFLVFQHLFLKIRHNACYVGPPKTIKNILRVLSLTVKSTGVTSLGMLSLLTLYRYVSLRAWSQSVETCSGLPVYEFKNMWKWRQIGQKQLTSISHLIFQINAYLLLRCLRYDKSTFLLSGQIILTLTLMTKEQQA